MRKSMNFDLNDFLQDKFVNFDYEFLVTIKIQINNMMNFNF